MAKPREEKTLRQTMREQMEQIDRDHPIIKSRWYIVEVVPSKQYSYDNGHGQYEHNWTKKEFKAVSANFDSKEKAVKWLKDFKKTMEPDEGNHFEIHRQDLRASYSWWSPRRDG